MPSTEQILYLVSELLTLGPVGGGRGAQHRTDLVDLKTELSNKKEKMVVEKDLFLIS